jgi:hypothetical protein
MVGQCAGHYRLEFTVHTMFVIDQDDEYLLTVLPVAVPEIVRQDRRWPRRRGPDGSVNERARSYVAGQGGPGQSPGRARLPSPGAAVPEYDFPLPERRAARHQG